MNNLHRIFLAINLPDAAKTKLGALQGQWPDLPANWTKKENFHVTLVFFGNASDQETADICKTTRDAAGRHDPFILSFNRVSYGPSQKIPPRMVWLQGERSFELGSLRQDLENTLYQLGNGRVEKTGAAGFSPHITLARIRQFEIRKMDPEEVPGIEEDMALSFMVESVEVMESELKRGGPVYTVLESAKLGGD